MFSKSGFFAAALMGLSSVNAHMIMNQPTPYSKDSLNNSPLAADGSDFPCKLRSNTYEEPAQETVAKIGEAMPLSFEGSATHGGGSCQVSLTTDRKPSKSSEWKVIKSIEGGCPANVDGNLSGGPDSLDPYKFNYTIPEGIEPGKYTLAWTWFNRIGNREMYMNCAPITVSDGSSSKRSTESEQEQEQEPAQVEKRSSSSFPPMFVANVNGCTTPESVDIRFPNPGDNVEYAGQPSNLQKEGSQACSGTPSFGGAGNSEGSSSGGDDGSSSGSSSSSSAPAQQPTPAATLSVSLSVPAVPAPTQSQSSAPGVFVPTGGSGGQPSQSSKAPSSPMNTSGSGSSSGSSGSSGSKSGSCSPEGLWNCIDGSSFQRCASGKWSGATQMAAGTHCTVGQSQNLAVAATALKPRLISAMRHAKRAHGGHHA